MSLNTIQWYPSPFLCIEYTNIYHFASQNNTLISVTLSLDEIQWHKSSCLSIQHSNIYHLVFGYNTVISITLSLDSLVKLSRLFFSNFLSKPSTKKRLYRNTNVSNTWVHRILSINCGSDPQKVSVYPCCLEVISIIYIGMFSKDMIGWICEN